MADEYIRLDTTIIAIDRLINEAATGTMARTLFKAKDTLYSQQRYVIDVQPVISGDNCIVCGRNVHKDDVYYDVNGGTICEACMNTKCKCKNGRRCKE